MSFTTLTMNSEFTVKSKYIEMHIDTKNTSFMMYDDVYPHKNFTQRCMLMTKLLWRQAG